MKGSEGECLRRGKEDLLAMKAINNKQQVRTTQ